jgi:hypothetical protein
MPAAACKSEGRGQSTGTSSNPYKMRRLNPYKMLPVINFSTDVRTKKRTKSKKVIYMKKNIFEKIM